MRHALALLCLTSALAACSTDPTDGKVSAATCPDSKRLDLKATLSLTEASGAPAKDQYTLDVSTAGAQKPFVFQIGNVANVTTAKEMLVKSITLTETELDGTPAKAPLFTCLGPDGKQPCATSTWLPIVPAGLDANCSTKGAVTSQPFTILFSKSASPLKHRLKVTVQVTGDPAVEKTPRVIVFLTESGVPSLKCSKTDVDFGLVSLGQDASSTVQCSNLGTDTVFIEKAEVLTQTGMPLTVTFGTATAVVGTPYVGTPGQAIEPGDTLEIHAQLAKLTSSAHASATVQLRSNDPSTPVTEIRYLVNTTGPCLTIDAGDPLDLGLTAVGQPVTRPVLIQNCGSEDLTITSIAMAAGSDPSFKPDCSGSCFVDGQCPTPDKPLKIPVEQKTCTIFVTFSPGGVVSGAKGTLEIESNAGKKTLGLLGSGTQASCPVACVTLKAKDPKGVLIAGFKQGDPVIPQTTLLLDGNCSTAPAGHVPKTFKYTIVSQPAGSFAFVAPAATLTKPAAGNVGIAAIAMNAAGKYKLKLDLTDDAGTPACQPLLLDITVVPDDKLHIELTWDTPGDPDPTDEGDPLYGKKDGKFVGSDMDLHLAHPDALDYVKSASCKNTQEDPWFTPLTDCDPVNKVQKWGDGGTTDDDPREDLDDKDGWGPENTNIHIPQAGLQYFVGVNYWAEDGFGPSTPRVRIYLDNSPTPTFDKIGPQMVQHDMWCVGRLAWSPNQLTPCTGADSAGNLLTHKYKADYNNLNMSLALCPSASIPECKCTP
jgi:hypothetical protein